MLNLKHSYFHMIIRCYTRFVKSLVTNRILGNNYLKYANTN